MKSRVCDPTAVRTSRGCGRTFQSSCSMDRCSSGTDNSDRCSGKICGRCFAKKNHLYLTEREAAKQISAAVLDGKQVGLWIGEGLVFEQEDFQKSCLKELILCGSQEELYSFAEEHPVVVITKTAEEGRQFVESLAGSLWGGVRNNVCGCERKPCILLCIQSISRQE